MSANVISITSNIGGLSTFHLASAVSTNATLIKNGPGKIYGWAITNTNASFRYICFHDLSVAPTAGIAVSFKYGIPAAGASNYNLDFGMQFNSGIGMTTVQNPADSDATGLSANDLIINIFYK